MKCARLSMLLFLGASIAGAATLTVGPHGQYSTVCTAVYAAHDGDTVLIDANHGIPYIAPPDPHHSDGRTDCTVNQNYLTIRGVNGRAILDAGPNAYADGTYVQKGIFVLNGHDITIDNLELRNAGELVNPNNNDASGIRVQASQDSTGTPDGGNITVTHSYIHNNDQGILTADLGPPLGEEYFSPNPFILLENDDFARNGDGGGQDHNIYIGVGGNLKFTLRHSWTHDSNAGIEVKSRAPYNYIFHNIISDPTGNGGFTMELPQGGTTYIVGNLIERGPACANCNQVDIYWRIPEYDPAPDIPAYGPPNEDLHFNNNVVINDAANTFPDQYVTVGCIDNPSTDCPPPAPGEGDPLVTPPIFENNLFIGPQTYITNVADAVLRHNLLLPYSDIAAAGYKLPQSDESFMPGK